MAAFRILLAALLIALLVFTAAVIAAHGWDFVSPFFGAIAAGTWQGQFNADFAILLLLIGLWAAWRNRFSAAGLLLGALGIAFGAGFLTSYLLYLIWKERGDMGRVLTGRSANER